MLYFVILIKFRYQAWRKNPKRSFMALSAPRLRAAQMAQILFCEVCDIVGLGHELTSLMTTLADIGWVINL